MAVCPACQLVEIENEDEPERNVCRMCEQMELAVTLPITDTWFWIEPADEFSRWFRKFLGLEGNNGKVR